MDRLDKYRINNHFFYTQRGTKNKIDKRNSMHCLDSVWNRLKTKPVNSGEWYCIDIACKILCSKSENLDKINSAKIKDRYNQYYKGISRFNPVLT